MAVGSFSAGLSGLNANATYLSVIGNNLANINTIGYKASAVSFADLVSQNVGGSGINPMQVGLGVVTGSISPVFSQGAIETTREAANVAIQGNGFFIVRGEDGNAYTRAGNFTFNADGEMVTTDGWHVQGYTQVDPVSGDVVTTGGLQDIVVPPGVLRAPVSTTNIRGEINLDAGAAVAAGTDYTVPFKVYDSLGSTHDITIEFDKTGPGTWTYTATVPQADVNGGTGVFQLATGTLTFNGAGQLTAPGAEAPTGVPKGAPISVPRWGMTLCKMGCMRRGLKDEVMAAPGMGLRQPPSYGLLPVAS
jgi:flagellar hook protein FlgE